MEKRTCLLKRVGITAAVFIVLVYGVSAVGVEKRPDPSAAQRADVIMIDTMQNFGKLERPAVPFFHDGHTAALKKKDKDCQTCHLMDKDRLSIKFKRLKDTDKKTVMNVYHDNCLACHWDMAGAGEKSGPLVCGECHTDVKRAVSVRQPMGMDNSLHFRHSKAMEKKCETCHHEYSEREKKLIYVKGKEGTCRYCHKAEKEENRIAMREASHLDCLSCHRERLLKKQPAGPIECGGCHDPLERQMIDKVASVPRMERKQPDVVFVKTGETGQTGGGDGKPVVRMNRVPFNHRGHETYNNTCRVCHHASLTACSDCHTVGGEKKGDFVKLEQSMHQLQNDQSCLGCHDARQRDKACAGCHSFMAKNRPQDLTVCGTCHQNPPAGTPAEDLRPDNTALAAAMLEARPMGIEIYPEKDIPEKVIIGTLSKRFEAVELPHRKIIQTMVGRIRDSKLASTFHTDPGTLCQGCHHNSPLAKKPPTCASCHGKPFDEKDLFKPGLSGAYHRQCMECHQAMEIKKPDSRDCASCHLEKK